MKLHLTDRSNKENRSFTARKNSYPHFLKLWHYHVELELILILKSKGTRFVGDSIEKFEEGEVLLIGENLPHMMFNDEAYFKSTSTLKAEAIAIHFKKDFLSQIREMEHISALCNRAARGISFENLSPDTIYKIQHIVSLTNGFYKTIQFLEILNELASQTEFRYLASDGFVNSFKKHDDKNLDKVYEYIFKNFNADISLTKVAEIAGMNPSAFSRFFTRVNRKTFTKYVNEIRIGYACKLLIENKHNITTICYESGFNNISNFNRQFRLINGLSPSEYLLKHTKN